MNFLSISALYLIAFWAALLHPYEFVWPEQVLLGDFFAMPGTDMESVLETFAHVILFLPPGFVVGQRRNEGRPIPGGLVLGGVLVLALGSEAAQYFVDDRSPSALDALADGLGVILGFWLARVMGGPAFMARRDRLFPGWTRSMLALPVVVFILTLIALKDLDYFDWDASYPLVLGNENTLDRPWTGELYELALFGRALSVGEALALSAGTKGVVDDPLLRYAFEHEQLRSNEDGLQAVTTAGGDNPGPRLEVLDPDRVHPLPGGGIGIDLGGALRSISPPTGVYEAFRQSGALTVLVAFRAVDPRIDGPGRIISLSPGVTIRNLTIGQAEQRLVFRGRNRITGPNGSQPEISATDCLRLGIRQRLVAVFLPQAVYLYTDGRICKEGSYAGLPYPSLLMRTASPIQTIGALFVGWFFLYLFLRLLLEWDPSRRPRQDLLASSIAVATLATMLAADFLMS